jgi:hypothetical protein
MIHISVILLIAVFIIFPPRTAGSAHGGDPLIKINVFSKQVRLLREGKLPQFTCFVGNDSVLRYGPNNEVGAGDTIVFTMHDGRCRMTVGSKNSECRGRITIHQRSGQGMFTVLISGERREYPLPLEIVCDNGLPRFYVLERLRRYVIDSALAEFGPAYQNEKEAVHALSLVLLGRYRHAAVFPGHDDAHFCDLTHCQVYRGRLKTDINFNGAWVPAHDSISRNLFFHSRCGGRTFGPGVFGKRDAGQDGVRDWLYRYGINLCLDAHSAWSRAVGASDLYSILIGDGRQAENRDLSLEYDKGSLRINVRVGAETLSYPPETLRLKLNRLKGWNFLKSNNYSVSEEIKTAEKYFIFQGAGLGHGAGLCQHGAVSLSKLGYNRYEIIEHYFPKMTLEQGEDASSYPPYLSYAVFDLASGDIIATCHGPDFMHRRQQPGSIFKLMVSLYLAAERPDIFKSYTYTCSGKNVHNSILPARCWKSGGHGTVGIKEAIANSCNLYFASLYDKIPQEKFRAFFKAVSECLDIRAELPETADVSQWSGLLAGLDSRLSISVGDYIRLVRYLNSTTPRTGDRGCPHLAEQGRLEIFKALEGTFIHGTASGPVKPFGPSCNYNRLKELKEKADGRGQQHGLWGKTSTVLDGTNRAVSYGIFIGGYGNRGIVAVLRKGNGNLAAHWARLLLAE